MKLVDIATVFGRCSLGLLGGSVGGGGKASRKISPFSAVADFRRQILMSKVDPRTERIKNYNDRTFADFKLKKTFGLHSLYKNISAL